MKGKVLIFGAGGFVGPYLVDEFGSNGYEVFGSDINEHVKKINFIKGDILNFDDVCSAVGKSNPDIIINLAAVSSVGVSWEIPQTTVEVNVVGTLNILEAARKQKNIPKVLFVGSSEEYEVSDKPISENAPLNANTPYGISKVAQEKFAKLYRDRYDMQIYCVRAFNHTGIGQKETFALPSFCKQVAEIEKSGKPGVIKVGNLSAKRDFSNVKDIVRAYRMVIEKGNSNKIYNIGSGKAYGLDEMLKYIISLSSQKIDVQVDQERFRPVDTPIICCDNRLIYNEVGWKAEYGIFDTLKDMFEYFKRN